MGDMMNLKNIIKNALTSILIGVLLGAIAEISLILDITWLIRITQSFLFWGLIMCVSAFMAKKYVFALMNPIIIMTLMNSTYYIIRFLKSGYTNISSWEMFALTGIAGSLYLGTIVYMIKERFIKHNPHISMQVYAFIFMTICMIAFTTYCSFNYIFNNLFYAIDIGVIAGFTIGLILNRIHKHLKKR